MSSLVTPVNGDVVTVHCVKHLKTNPSLEWSNTYDFKVLDAASGTLFTYMMDAVLNFEQVITLNTVHFTEIRVSTFLPDSKPYNPEAFMAHAVDVDGANGTASDPLPIGYAWLIERLTATGRLGKLFLRGVNLEGEVNSAGGFPAFTDPAATSTRLSDALAAGSLHSYFSPGVSDAVMVIAHYNRTTHVVTTREVEGFVSKAPILAKISRRRKTRAHILPS